jgi:diguanylate cyclase (GGDEF)-like protein/PAS domain S-box-containing protein
MRCNFLVAVIMGSTVSGMHYTAMSAAYFVRGDVDALPTSLFTTNTLALMIALASIFLALAMLILATLSRNREMTQRLRESEERWKFALEGTGDGLWDWNPQTDGAFFSKRWKEMIGYREDEFPNTGSAWAEQLHPDDQHRVLSSVQDYFSAILESYSVEFRMRCKNGEWRWFRARGKIIERDGQNKPVRMIGTHTDITEQKLNEAELRIAATAFHSQEGIIVTDASQQILRVNRAFTEITGYLAEDAVGKRPNFLQSGRHDAAFYQSMWQEIKQNGAWEGEIWNRRKNGEIFPEHLTITAVMDNAGIVSHYVGSLIDISLAKAAEVEIRNLAFYDPLTRLPNRRLLRDRLHQSMAASARNGLTNGLLFIDLDNFKNLNDTLGHAMGDQLLVQVAERLLKGVREGDTVSRLGGDEFVVLLEELSQSSLEAAEQAKSIGEKLLESLNQPYFLNGHEHHSTPSIGAVVYFGHRLSIEEVMKQADIAMYQAKSSGRNVLRFFDPQMQMAITRRLDLESELHKALEQEQLRLYYQPQIDDRGQTIGFEALARWIHPERGFISPGEFIPLAEESGQILPLGVWVLETACRQLQTWQTASRGNPWTISVNVSAKQFRQPDFEAHVQQLLNRYQIMPSSLKLELTESMLLENIEDIIARMNAIKQLGVKFSLDDFGTGYSSLQYLKRLPLDQLKIDQSFVRDLEVESNDRAIVRTIIAMARSLNLNLIAEGVETEWQRDWLMEEGCHQFQGYLFGKPAPIEMLALAQ